MKKVYGKRKNLIFCLLCSVLLFCSDTYAVDIVISQESMNRALEVSRQAGALNFHDTNVNGIDVVTIDIQSIHVALYQGNKIALSLSTVVYAEEQWGLAWSMRASFDVTADAKLTAGLIEQNDLSKGYKLTVEVQSVDIANWQTRKSTLGTSIPDYIFSTLDGFESWLVAAIPEYSVTAGIGIMKNLDNKFIEITPTIYTDNGQLTLRFETIPADILPPVTSTLAAVQPVISFLLEPLPGDIDDDGTVDMTDLRLLLNDLHKSVDACACGDLCDLDGDEMITIYDSRQLTTRCTWPRCAP